VSRHRVLIVDDEREQRRLFLRVFEAHGLEARGASSASQALEMIRDAAARPDVILADIVMPGLDGVAFVKALHAAPETASIPVILMTGRVLPRGMLEVAAETLRVGPVFIKGGEVGALLARVKDLLRAPVPRKPSVVVDSLKRTVRIDGLQLPELAARRFQLLCAFLRRPHGLSREELLRQVWEGQDNLNIVDVTVLRLRQDLKDFPFLRIETVPGGYRLRIGPYSL
jgi:DNA-binding response OmpR family regulator